MQALLLRTVCLLRFLLVVSQLIGSWVPREKTGWYIMEHCVYPSPLLKGDIVGVG